jgi:phage shock protein A
MARGTDASTFVSSSSDADAVNNLKSFLEQDVARNSLETSIKAQEKVVKDGENTLKNLEKKIENLKKDIKETEDKKAAQIETNKAAKETLDNLLKQRK